MPNKKQFLTKELYNAHMRNYRKENVEKVRAYNRKYNKQWRKENGFGNEIKSKLRYPMKEKARIKVRDAIKVGKLVRMNCEVCNKADGQAHHDDYSKPLEVRWLCAIHHTEAHKEINPGKSLSEQEIRDYLIKRRQEIKAQDIVLKERRQKIAKLYPEFTLREIGKVFGITHQRVQQIVAKEIGAVGPEKVKINIKK